jgi:hypothetical protein
MEDVRHLKHQVASQARRHWMTLAFVAGFIVDNITLNRVDQLFDNIILLSYVVLAMLSILLLYAGIAERFNERTSFFLKKWMPVLMQYAFGGLLSGMLIFYGRSGSIMESWPFILMILAVIYGNETITNRQSRLVYNLVIFFIGLFAYVVLVVPVVTGKMGAWVFVGSGLIALAVMHVFFGWLERIVPNFIQLQKRNVVFIIGLIYVVMNVLYFTNVIPPIPLSMKHVGIYHNVVRIDDTYKLTYEKPVWWKWYRNSDEEFHYVQGESIYCYASVFAPSRLATDVYHRWQYYEVAEGKWKDHTRIAYSISGGRGEGYRGYTLINSYHEGKWRCVVETARGQVIGAETFEIVSGGRGELMTREE